VVNFVLRSLFYSYQERQRDKALRSLGNLHESGKVPNPILRLGRGRDKQNVRTLNRTNRAFNEKSLEAFFIKPVHGQWTIDRGQTN